MGKIPNGPPAGPRSGTLAPRLPSPNGRPLLCVPPAGRHKFWPEVSSLLRLRVPAGGGHLPDAGSLVEAGGEEEVARGGWGPGDTRKDKALTKSKCLDLSAVSTATRPKCKSDQQAQSTPLMVDRRMASQGLQPHQAPADTWKVNLQASS
jgi:hypothetical protein